MICPILFIRKPEEAECLKERCSFWVKADVLESEADAPERFSAVITGPATRHQAPKPAPVDGKCAILTIAEKMAAPRE
ncbi:MAG TPA: hypothetical protein VMF29_03075 [Candidatus Edwardsbacteria bacterium]|nr:hypothetical protein [Candidatus Edwardsbacteria bacterium]